MSPTAASRYEPQHLRALILAALAGGGAAACGGVVVYDDGAGGSGGASSTSSTTNATSSTSVTNGTAQSSSSSGNFVCEFQPWPDGSLEYMCLPLSGPCPQANSEKVLQAANELVWQWDCEGDCCGFWVESVPCGPDPNASQCCYVSHVILTEACAGRPFFVGGQALVSGLRLGGPDWTAQADGLDDRTFVNSLDDSQRGAIGASYRQAGLYEHASVASFARFALDLMSLGAPPDLLLETQRAMADEVRHAQLCFMLAAHFDGVQMSPGPLSMDGLSLQPDPAAIAAATVLEGCVGETLSAALAAAESDAASDPIVKAALAEIAEDEARHAALAWRSVAWMVRTFGAPVRHAVEAAFSTAKPFQVAAGPLEGVAVPLRAAAGRLTEGAAQAVVETAMREVVLASAKELLRTGAQDKAQSSAAFSALQR